MQVINLAVEAARRQQLVVAAAGDDAPLLHHQDTVGLLEGEQARFAANQLRLLLSVTAYVLFQVLQGFAGATALGSAQVWTLRERLVKVAVWVERSVRRIVLHLPQAFPWREPWRDLVQALTLT